MLAYALRAVREGVPGGRRERPREQVSKHLHFFYIFDQSSTFYFTYHFSSDFL